MKDAADRACDGAGDECLCCAGWAFEQDVTAREDCHEQGFDDGVMTDHRLGDLFLRDLEKTVEVIGRARTNGAE